MENIKETIGGVKRNFVTPHGKFGNLPIKEILLTPLTNEEKIENSRRIIEFTDTIEGKNR